MAGWFGINREISREQHGSGPTESRPADQPRAPEKPREAGAHLYAVVDNARGMAAAVRDTSGPTEGADSTGNRPEVEPAAPAQRKPHLNLLGIDFPLQLIVSHRLQRVETDRDELVGHKNRFVV